jgi:hypothetical protein
MGRLGTEGRREGRISGGDSTSSGFGPPAGRRDCDDGTLSAQAAKAATTTIPIVFGTGLDPVETGLVARLDRPGGNVTGITHMNAELGPKRLGLLHDLTPGATRIAALVPSGALTTKTAPGPRAAASALGVQIELFYVSTALDADASFASLLQKRRDALMVNPGLPFERRVQILTLAIRHAPPAIYPSRGRGHGRADELRDQPHGSASTGRHLYRPHSQGREARRASDHAASNSSLS